MTSVRAMRRAVLALVATTATIVATGCGLKDDLYLPAEDAAAPADAAAPGAGPGADDEEDPAPADPKREAG